MTATHPQVIAAIAEARAAGYRGDFAVDVTTIPPSLLCLTCHRYVLARTVTVDVTRSCESPTDGQTVVFAITCPRCGGAGALVHQRAATTPEEDEVIAELGVPPTAPPRVPAASDVRSANAG